MKTRPILVVEDDPDLREALCTTLELAGYTVLVAHHGQQALELLKHHEIAMVFSDVQMKPMDGYQLLREIKAHKLTAPVILMPAYGQVEQAVTAMHEGASDYLLKPFEPARLIALAERYFASAPEQSGFGVVAEDAATKELLAMAEKVAKFSTTVLLTGESGVGKEVVAKFIHRRSNQCERPFVAINCAAIPENLLEATLFGYEKGAFTGATQSHPGKFEQAQGGTLLLDEISEMPMSLQAKLLRVLQERVVEKVGGNKLISIDIRVIATSNKELRAQVTNGKFREDLFYRLNVFPLWVPPLRARPKDILPLAQLFLHELGHKMERSGLSFSQESIGYLSRYDWPGNVRELENTIHRAIILALDNTVELEIPDFALPPTASVNLDTIDQLCVPDDIESVERMHILRTLAEVNGSRKLAVKKLGISERTLRYKLQRYRQTEMN